jgi:Uma2 family endonuclease
MASLDPNMSAIPIRTRRWTRVAYERMIDCGILHEDDRVELLDGLLVVKEPQGDPHAIAVDLALASLRQAFGAGWLVRPHAPLAVGGRSRPEPDITVVPGAPRDYRRTPRHAALVLEVSDSRLAYDRTRKAAVYARGGIADYWIVNLVDMVVEIRRDPGRLAPPGHGWAYRSLKTFRPPESIAPLAAPGSRIPVADLLP